MSFAPYLAAHREARARAAEARALRVEAAKVEAARAAERLGAAGLATRVVLFGSLARGGFHERSDIDLAVSGIPDGALFRAMRIANDRAPFEISIVPYEHARPHIREAIDTEGIELWRR